MLKIMNSVAIKTMWQSLRHHMGRYPRVYLILKVGKATCRTLCIARYESSIICRCMYICTEEKSCKNIHKMFNKIVFCKRRVRLGQDKGRNSHSSIRLNFFFFLRAEMFASTFNIKSIVNQSTKEEKSTPSICSSSCV